MCKCNMTVPGRCDDCSPVGHPHALLMMEYAKDCLSQRYPTGWQFRLGPNEVWADFKGAQAPMWVESIQYRRKPKTILINGIEVPEPLRVAPNKGTQMWYVGVFGVELANRSTWEG